MEIFMNIIDFLFFICLILQIIGSGRRILSLNHYIFAPSDSYLVNVTIVRLRLVNRRPAYFLAQYLNDRNDHFGVEYLSHLFAYIFHSRCGSHVRSIARSPSMILFEPSAETENARRY